MKTFSIHTLGCKVNQYESGQICQLLENNGLQRAKPGCKPDLCVVNTCCVTATASAKSRQYIKRAQKLNEHAVLVVCGCLARQTNELKFEKTYHLIADPNMLASKLQQILENARSECSRTNSTNTHHTPLTTELPLLTKYNQTRAFLKVQDGCESQCSYCIIPKVRPAVQSKSIENTLFEAKNLVAAGHKEIVVTGVNLRAYGQDIADSSLSFVSLLNQLAKVNGLHRIRVSSLEPGNITEDLLNTFRDNKNIMPHIHLSVQSGSSRILRRMCRQYDAGELKRKIELIENKLEKPAITCDIIVGFPGETDEDFQETAELARWAGFSKMHIFPFSARAGTAAAKMKDKVASNIIKQRAEVLRKLGDDLGRKFREQFIGQKCEVLIESSKNGRTTGHCERYFMVHLTTKKNLMPGKNVIVKAKISANRTDGAEAEILNSE